VSYSIGSGSKVAYFRVGYRAMVAAGIVVKHTQLAVHCMFAPHYVSKPGLAAVYGASKDLRNAQPSLRSVDTPNPDQTSFRTVMGGDEQLSRPVMRVSELHPPKRHGGGMPTVNGDLGLDCPGWLREQKTDP